MTCLFVVVVVVVANCLFVVVVVATCLFVVVVATCLFVSFKGAFFYRSSFWT